MSDDADEKASDVLTLLITPKTTTLSVIFCIRTIDRRKRVTVEPNQFITTHVPTVGMHRSNEFLV